MTDHPQDLLALVADALYAHDTDRMSCADHDGACCPDGDAHDLRGTGAREHMAAAILTAVSAQERTETAYDVATQFDSAGKPVAFGFRGDLAECRKWLPRLRLQRPESRIVRQQVTYRWLPNKYGPYEVVE